MQKEKAGWYEHFKGTCSERQYTRFRTYVIPVKSKRGGVVSYQYRV